MRIAHLTDLHVLERHAARRRGGDRVRLEVLCNGRAVDPEDRRSRLLRALREVASSGADQLVITGDLTEDGTPAQFEYLAEILCEARVDPRRTTLVAGNHDAYSGYAAYAAALNGPLAPFASSSRAGGVVHLGTAVILPVCTRVEQPFVRAVGMVGEHARASLARTLRDPAFAHTPSIVAIHHPLIIRTLPAWHWFDGLVDAQEMTSLLGNHRRTTVLHGHFHRKMDLPIGNEVRARARGAHSVADHRQPLRLYDLVDGHFVPGASSSHVRGDERDRRVDDAS